MINLKLIESIKQNLAKDFKGLPNALAQFGITESALNYSLSRSFESFKVCFENEEKRTLEVKGSDTGLHVLECGEPLEVYYDVFPDQVATWTDELVGPMIEAIEREFDAPIRSS